MHALDVSEVVCAGVRLGPALAGVPLESGVDLPRGREQGEPVVGGQAVVIDLEDD